MTRHRTIVALLAAVAVLLGLNLIVGGSTPAAAQAQGMGRPPQVLTIHVRTTGEGGTAIYRLWSDGTVERNEHPFLCCMEVCPLVEWCGWQVVPE